MTSRIWIAAIFTSLIIHLTTFGVLKARIKETGKVRRDRVKITVIEKKEDPPPPPTPRPKEKPKPKPKPKKKKIASVRKTPKDKKVTKKPVFGLDKTSLSNKAQESRYRLAIH